MGIATLILTAVAVLLLIIHGVQHRRANVLMREMSSRTNALLVKSILTPSPFSRHSLEEEAYARIKMAHAEGDVSKKNTSREDVRNTIAAVESILGELTNEEAIAQTLLLSGR